MLGFLLRRIAALVPVLLGVTFLVVAVTKLIPGSPAEMRSEKLTREKAAEMNARYGYDRDVVSQWALFVRRAASLDLGESWTRERPVLDELREAFPATIELALAATLIAAVVGTALGVAAAVRPRGVIDAATSAVAIIGVSLPVFWLGLLLQILIAPVSQRLELADVLEPEQAKTGLMLVDTFLAGDRELFQHACFHLLLPAITLATVPLATIARMTRSALLEALAQDYVRTARAKGLSARTVVLKHALRNALIPIVTASGLHLAALLGGAVLTESVFTWPGIGHYIYMAAVQKDLPALQGAVVVVALVYVLMNLLVDVSYGIIDPRVRAE